MSTPGVSISIKGKGLNVSKTTKAEGFLLRESSGENQVDFRTSHTGLDLEVRFTPLDEKRKKRKKKKKPIPSNASERNGTIKTELASVKASLDSKDPTSVAHVKESNSSKETRTVSESLNSKNVTQVGSAEVGSIAKTVKPNDDSKTILEDTGDVGMKQISSDDGSGEQTKISEDRNDAEQTKMDDELRTRKESKICEDSGNGEETSMDESQINVDEAKMEQDQPDKQSSGRSEKEVSAKSTNPKSHAAVPRRESASHDVSLGDVPVCGPETLGASIPSVDNLQFNLDVDPKDMTEAVRNAVGLHRFTPAASKRTSTNVVSDAQESESKKRKLDGETHEKCVMAADPAIFSYINKVAAGIDVYDDKVMGEYVAQIRGTILRSSAEVGSGEEMVKRPSFIVSHAEGVKMFASIWKLCTDLVEHGLERNLDGLVGQMNLLDIFAKNLKPENNTLSEGIVLEYFLTWPAATRVYNVLYEKTQTYVDNESLIAENAEELDILVSILSCISELNISLATCIKAVLIARLESEEGKSSHDILSKISEWQDIAKRQAAPIDSGNPRTYPSIMKLLRKAATDLQTLNAKNAEAWAKIYLSSTDSFKILKKVVAKAADSVPVSQSRNLNASTTSTVPDGTTAGESAELISPQGSNANPTATESIALLNSQKSANGTSTTARPGNAEPNTKLPSSDENRAAPNASSLPSQNSTMPNHGVVDDASRAKVTEKEVLSTARSAEISQVKGDLPVPQNGRSSGDETTKPEINSMKSGSNRRNRFAQATELHGAQKSGSASEQSRKNGTTTAQREQNRQSLASASHLDRNAKQGGSSEARASGAGARDNVKSSSKFAPAARKEGQKSPFQQAHVSTPKSRQEGLRSNPPGESKPLPKSVLAKPNPLGRKKPPRRVSFDKSTINNQYYLQFRADPPKMKRGDLDRMINDTGHKEDGGVSPLLDSTNELEVNEMNHRLSNLTLGSVLKLYGTLFWRIQSMGDYYHQVEAGHPPVDPIQPPDAVPVPAVNAIVQLYKEKYGGYREGN